MNIRFKYFLLFFLLFFTKNIFAQDLHFTQLLTSPLYLNPANTGIFKGDFRVVANYRSQWRSIEPLTTVAAGFDMPVFFKGKKINAGIFLANDKSSPVRFIIQKALLSVSIDKSSGLNIFSIGLQGGIVSKGFDESKMTFPEQFNWNTGYFDGSMTYNESFNREPIRYPEINIGGLWKYEGKSIQPALGVSFFHLTQPKESIFGGKDKLNIRKIYYGSTVVKFGQKFFIEPQVIYMEQAKATDMIACGKAGIFFPNSNLESIYAGGSVRDGKQRNTDAAMATLGLKLKSWEFVFNYDFNISELKSLTNGNGAMEVSLIYISYLTRASKIQIPCEQF